MGPNDVAETETTAMTKQSEALETDPPLALVSSDWLGHVAGARNCLWFRSQADARQEVYRHRKTGGIYGVVCNATRESDGELLVVYRNVETGERWVRPASEFNDGRFERVA